jgi:hypothetical protein
VAAEGRSAKQLQKYFREASALFVAPIAFGYEANQHGISQALAERALVPKIRRAGPGALVISDGFSCRSQVRHFSPEARVVHLAQVLDDQNP